MSSNTTLRQPAVAFDVQKVRRDFPILRQKIHGKPLVYLDNAATTQKPQAVIDAMVRSYAEDNANIHRGVHLLSERATRAYEDAELAMDLLAGRLTERTKLVPVLHVASSLGTINPITTIDEKAHARGIPVLVDGAQAVAHMPVDVQALGSDFYAMSGHKLFGP